MHARWSLIAGRARREKKQKKAKKTTRRFQTQNLETDLDLVYRDSTEARRSFRQLPRISVRLFFFQPPIYKLNFKTIVTSSTLERTKERKGKKKVW